MQLTKDQVRNIAYALDLDPDSDSDVRTDYSGRGMYGDRCLGFVIDVPDVLVGVALATVLDENDAWEIARDARIDSMGRSTIIYFPGWTVEDDDSVLEG